jgi:YD repeat-containing protein
MENQFAIWCRRGEPLRAGSLYPRFLLFRGGKSSRSPLFKPALTAIAIFMASLPPAGAAGLGGPTYSDSNDGAAGPNSYVVATCAPTACSACTAGMATWNVSEPYINLWLTDEPLGYNPGLGNRISFQLDYKQRESMAGTNPAVFSCGSNWDCSWISYVISPSASPTNGSPMTMVVPNGGQRSYIANGASPEYYTRSVMSVKTNASGVLTNCTVAYPNGASESYNYVFSGSAEGVLFFRTAQTDPQGHSTQFIYTNSSTNIVLTSVVDTDGRATTLSYTNTSFPSQITGVTDPFNRHTTLKYNNAGLLTNITDVMNLTSAFGYASGTNNWINSLTTPYGTTTFTLTDNQMVTQDAVDRAVMVVDPLGGTNLYVSRYQRQLPHQ